MVDFINFSIINTFCLSGFKLLLVAALSLLCLLFTRLYSQKIGLVARTIQITLLLCAVLYTHYWWQHPGWCCDYTGFTFRSRDQTWLTGSFTENHENNCILRFSSVVSLFYLAHPKLIPFPSAFFFDRRGNTGKFPSQKDTPVLRMTCPWSDQQPGNYVKCCHGLSLSKNGYEYRIF